MELLEKTRRVTRLLQNDAGSTVDFSRICQVLSELMEANVYLVDRNGHIWGYALTAEYQCSIMEKDILQREVFPPEYTEDLQRFRETRANIDHSGHCVFDWQTECAFPRQMLTMVPIYGGGYRLGTLILAKFRGDFSEHDLVLAEYSAAVAGLEILRYRESEAEQEVRERASVQVALDSLSFSEQEAMQHIFDELEGSEGLLVASKIADRMGITRSVIVNALRKFESAGVIESRSLGMKGTYIRVLNQRLLDELNRLR